MKIGDKVWCIVGDNLREGEVVACKYVLPMTSALTCVVSVSDGYLVFEGLTMNNIWSTEQLACNELLKRT